MLIDFLGEQRSYRLLNILEFTSARKRMSVVVEDSNGRIMLFTKGADSIVFPLLNTQKSLGIKET